MVWIDRRVFTHFDIFIPLLILPIILISFYLVSEANDILGQKQLVYYVVGFGSFLLFFIFPIRKIEWIIPFTFWIGIALLVSVELFGIEKLGAKRWLEIPFVHFTIQPSEIFKPSFLLMLAYIIKNNPPPQTGYEWKDFLKISFYIMLPFIIIAKEPDLGTALILLIVSYTVLFAVGVNKKIWITLILALSISSPILFNSLHDYQKKRITDFIGEKPSYHVQQSIIAIGSGGLFGKEKEEATQTHFKFLPIATSDFIFAYTVERFGFFGVLMVIIFYILLITHILFLSLKLKEDYMAKVFAVGLAAMIFTYMSVNIAMTIGLAPVVGVPLPFYSYGGSSFITFMILFGIMENMLTFRFDRFYGSIKYH